jgi:hypothetical protein
MVEFNPDGSLKLDARFVKQRADHVNKLKVQRCMKVKKEILSFTAPKKCVLHLTISEKITDLKFVENLFNYFKENASVPCSIRKITERQFDVEIGTDFRRCTDCCSLIGKYREFMDGNIIEEKGTCTFEGRKQNFSYEDYFD